VVLGLMLYNGSVLAEVFRAGILALPRGQSEAAYALGLRKTQVMVLILLPQALRSMMPTIISQLVVLLKDTALGFLITYDELLHFAQFYGGQGQFGRPFIPVAIVVAAIYIGMCLLLAWFANYLQKRERRSKKHIDLTDGGAGANQLVLAADAGGGGGSTASA
jgi:glutamate transport system permease protein